MVSVLNHHKEPLNPCSNARARILLAKGKAVVHKKFPFTIRLKKEVVDIQPKPLVLKFDPGAMQTGIAVVEDKAASAKVVFFATIQHRTNIKSNLDTRRAFRRRRRNQLRYRKPRFNNRTRHKGWLSPSVQSIVDNIKSWTVRLKKLFPIGQIAVETVRFDTQLLENLDISGVEYQQGTLWGYEVREYLLYRDNHECQYCQGATGDAILEVEHKVSKHHGGTNRVKNLIIACETCNKAKDSFNLDQWLEVLKRQKQDPLTKARISNIVKLLEGKVSCFKDAAKVNSSRKAVYRVLSKYTDDLEVASGGTTKYNRAGRGLPKTHYFDALCVGKNVPESFVIPKGLKVLSIKALGRGNRSRTNLDGFGFPRGYLPRQKSFFGFMTGDLVKAIVSTGVNKGTWIGKVAIRKTGSFKITLSDNTKKDGVNHKYCNLLNRADGYSYGLNNISA